MGLTKRKNVLLIIADQLSWKALPVYGNNYVKTPNIDRIASRGVCFETCYTACPLCQPSRAALWTSRYSHELDVRSNGRRWPVRHLDDQIPTLGETFRHAGYNTIHFGKMHDAGALRGFDVICSDPEKIEDESPGLPLNGDTFMDRSTRKNVVKYLEEYRDPKPFFVVADLVNPHNICGWIGAFAGKEPNPWLRENLPPLPDNFDVEDMETRPRAVQYICCTHNRQAQASGWDQNKYRQYLYAYYYYIGLMDQEVGRILDALEKSGKAQDTVVVFISDHGESMAARRRVTKQIDFYEEVTRVPFIVGGAGVKFRAEKIQGLSSLLDLFPTLCGLSEINCPVGVRGLNLSDFVQGKKERIDRPYVVSQWHTEWGFTVSPGRMLCNGRYKYIEYLENEEAELYDLQNDPGEKKNLLRQPEYREQVCQMRALLNQYIADTDDDFRSLQVIVDPSCRSHKAGYNQHFGLALPERREKERFG